MRLKARPQKSGIPCSLSPSLSAHWASYRALASARPPSSSWLRVHSSWRKEGRKEGRGKGNAHLIASLSQAAAVHARVASSEG